MAVAPCITIMNVLNRSTPNHVIVDVQTWYCVANIPNIDRRLVPSFSACKTGSNGTMCTTLACLLSTVAHLRVSFVLEYQSTDISADRLEKIWWIQRGQLCEICANKLTLGSSYVSP